MPKTKKTQTTKPDWKTETTDTYGPTIVSAMFDELKCLVLVHGFKWGVKFYLDNDAVFETDFIFSTATPAILFAEFAWETMLSKKTVGELKEMNEKYFRGRK